MLGLRSSQVGSLLKLVDDRAWESLHLITGARTRRIRRPNTALYYSQSILRIANDWPDLLAMDAADVTPEMLADWQAKFSKRFAPDTVNGALTILRAVFRTAGRKGMIDRDPTADLQRLTVPDHPWTIPTNEQWQRAVDALRARAARRGKPTTTHQTLLVLWLAATGMRVQAATALRIGDVDFERATVRLDGAHAKNGRTALLPIGKAALDAARQAAGARDKPERLFLCVSARYALMLATAAAGVRINHHTLRKLFATRALEAGVAPAIAARLLTHQDGGQTLLKHYAAWRDDALRAAVARMEIGL
ncbi:MAG: site-specific integrase [Verrucomicrobia bacterium]|nr:site-specific integrase [Verrucomicrobiota bacterium]